MLCRIGDIEIWRILEGVTPLMPYREFFPALTEDDFARHRQMLSPSGILHNSETDEDWIVLAIQAFLVRTPRSLILVDACVGNDKTLPKRAAWNKMRSNRFMGSLVAAGASPEDVTHLLFTHLHVDHVGWATTFVEGRWVPTFPNADVVATCVDLEHAKQRAERAPTEVPAFVWQESIEPLLRGERFRTVSPDYELDPVVRLIPTPGHSPGHAAVQIGNAKGQRGAVITGDLIISPLQCALPDLAAVFDNDGATAAETRRSFLEQAVESQSLIFGSHFPLPSIGRIKPSGKTFRWIEAPNS